MSEWEFGLIALIGGIYVTMQWVKKAASHPVVKDAAARGAAYQISRWFGS